MTRRRRQTAGSANRICRAKSHLNCVRNGIYGTAATGNYGMVSAEAAEELIDQVLDPADYHWVVNAKKTLENGDRVIKVNIDPDNEFTLPNKKIELHLTVFHNGVEVYFKCFQVPSEFDEQEFIVNYDREHLSFNFNEAEMKVGIYIYPDNYLCDNFGLETRYDIVEKAHNAIILIDGERFYVIKQYLATWSKFFARLFFGNAGSRRRRQFRLDNIDVVAFDLFLGIIHQDRAVYVQDCNVMPIMDVAVKLEVPAVLLECAALLKDFDICPEIDLMNRLGLADKHKLISLQAAIFRKLHDCPLDEYKQFMEDNEERIKTLSDLTRINLETLRR